MPFIYLLTMIFSMIFTRTSQGSQVNSFSQKFMQIGMPIIFFFILYNTSSGLLLYWTVANIISITQQFVITNITKNKEKEAINTKGVDKPKGPFYNPKLPPKAKKK